MIVIFLGLPASGKGTQASMLAKYFSIPHLATGDMLRAAVAEGTELGKKAKALMDVGKFLPDEDMNSLIEENIKQDYCKNGFVLDGYPRTLQQAETLDSLIKKLNYKIDKAILLKVDSNILISRITGRFICADCKEPYHKITKPTKHEGICDKCGSGNLIQRADDSEEVMRKRIEIYEQHASKLINYYKNYNLLIEIDGMQSLEKVHADIVAGFRDIVELR